MSKNKNKKVGVTKDKKVITPAPAVDTTTTVENPAAAPDSPAPATSNCRPDARPDCRHCRADAAPSP